MPMSKKDFIALAASVKKTLSRYEPGTVERKVAVQMAYDMLPALRNANDRFQQGTFLDACGVTDEDRA